MSTVRNAYRKKLPIGKDYVQKTRLVEKFVKANSKLINEIDSPAPHTQIRNEHGLPVHLLRLA